jgi:hypothetical protein
MIEIHQPPNVKVIDGMPEDEDGKNGHQRLQEWAPTTNSGTRTSSGPRHEQHADIPFGADDLIDWLCGESHETRRTRSQDDTDRRRRH